MNDGEGEVTIVGRKRWLHREVALLDPFCVSILQSDFLVLLGWSDFAIYGRNAILTKMHTNKSLINKIRIFLIMLINKF